MIGISEFLARFIPTCMGNSSFPDAISILLSVHPHVHGELGCSSFRGPDGAGSSPRAWGTRCWYGDNRCGDRFIPTCMGNSQDRKSMLPPTSVHPHVHGELIDPKDITYDIIGSSPRAWGTQVVFLDLDEVVRFIPTCMGNSYSPGSTTRWRPVHPHVHGELMQNSTNRYREVGSSPRAWGTHL